MTLIRLLLVLAATTALVARAQSDCIATVESGRDYFPDKVNAEDSQFWSVTYHDTYKIVRNLAVNASYLLYQCGSSAPSSVVAANNFTAVMSIPLTSVGVAYTPMITFMEQLGLRDHITALLTDPAYVISPCFLDRVNDGDVVVLQDSPDPETGSVVTATGINLNQSTTDALAAFLPEGSAAAFVNRIYVSEQREVTNNAIFEWIKFYSVFFNQEARANQVYDAAQARFACLHDNVQAVKSQRAAQEQNSNNTNNTPTILWGYYSDYCQGWAYAICPNYYCEYAQNCGARILSAPSDTGTFVEECGAAYMSTDEFVVFGQDADVWITPAGNWALVASTFDQQIGNMTAVRMKQVYDFDKNLENGWFEQRFAKYYEVQNDVCLIVNATNSRGGRNWFRNVFTERADSKVECTAPNETILNDGNACLPIELDNDAGSSAFTFPAVTMLAATSPAMIGMLLLI